MTSLIAQKSLVGEPLDHYSQANPTSKTLAGKKILVIDGDRALCRSVITILAQEGAETYVAYTGDHGLRDLVAVQPDLVLLEHMIPGLNGFDMLKRIREISDVPIIMLSAIDDQEEVVRCLTTGADDYVTKPFQEQILVARVRATMRRLLTPYPKPRKFVYDDGYLTFDLEARIVKVANAEVRLSATEFALFRYFVLNAGRVCTFAQISDSVWGDVSPGSHENIHTFVYQLRRKVEPTPHAPSYIVSIRSIGYRFQLRRNE